MLKETKIRDVHFFATLGTEKDLVEAAYFSAIGDPSLESDAIFSKALDLSTELTLPKGSRLVRPEGKSSVSGIDFRDRKLRKGTLEEISAWLEREGAKIDKKTREIVAQVIEREHQALVVASQERELGVIELS